MKTRKPVGGKRKLASDVVVHDTPAPTRQSTRTGGKVDRTADIPAAKPRKIIAEGRGWATIAESGSEDHSGDDDEPQKPAETVNKKRKAGKSGTM